MVRTDRPPYEVLSTDWLSYGEVLKIKGTRRWWRSITTAGSLPGLWSF